MEAQALCVLGCRWAFALRRGLLPRNSLLILTKPPHAPHGVQLFLIKISYPDKTTPKNWAAVLSGSQGMQVPGGRLGLQEDAGGLCCSAEGRILQEPEEVWFQQGPREDGQDRAHSAPSHLMRLMNRGHSSLFPVISQPGQNCCSCCSQDDHQHSKHSRVRPFGAIFCIYLKICSLGSHVNPRLQIT